MGTYISYRKQLFFPCSDNFFVVYIVCLQSRAEYIEHNSAILY